MKILDFIRRKIFDIRFNLKLKKVTRLHNKLASYTRKVSVATSHGADAIEKFGQTLTTK